MTNSRILILDEDYRLLYMAKTLTEASRMSGVDIDMVKSQLEENTYNDCDYHFMYSDEYAMVTA